MAKTMKPLWFWLTMLLGLAQVLGFGALAVVAAIAGHPIAVLFLLIAGIGVLGGYWDVRDRYRKAPPPVEQVRIEISGRADLEQLARTIEQAERRRLGWRA